MKKPIRILLLAIFLSGCSSLPGIGGLLATPTSPPPADTQTPVPTTTPIPTQDFFATSTSTPLTFTPTVTALGAELFTPTNTETPFPTPTVGLPPGALGGTYFTPKDVGFTAVLVSNSVLYWNEGACTPRSIKVSAFVQDPVNTYKVFLFMRLREKRNTLNVTEWGAGAEMLKSDNGSFNYDIRTFNIRRYYYFKDAWLEYQLVAFDIDREVVGRTQIYDHKISLTKCLLIGPP